jgi:homoserine dehydrogenase
VRWTESFADVIASDADIVIELLGGIEPAHDFIRQALLAGKSVVTANKHVMAKHGAELLALARKTGQRLEYGASVGGAVPVLPALQYGLSGDRLLRVRGVLNGTCNYILSNMEERGTTLASALVSAQKLGYAEADPANDIHGLDAACKLAIVARLGLHAEVDPMDIFRQSIDCIAPVDFYNARQLGCTIRQISSAEVKRDSLVAWVGPALVPLRSHLANTHDNQNALVITGKNSGDTLLAGRGAGGAPTAVAVVSDLLAISVEKEPPPTLRLKSEVNDLWARHYIRTKTRAVPHLSQALADHKIRVQAILQEGNKKDSTVLTGKCRSATLRKAIADIQAVVLPLLD